MTPPSPDIIPPRCYPGVARGGGGAGLALLRAPPMDPIPPRLPPLRIPPPRLGILKILCIRPVIKQNATFEIQHGFIGSFTFYEMKCCYTPTCSNLLYRLNL